MKKLSVIMPVYNERQTVTEAVTRVLAADVSLEKELIIVDDGSTDGTVDILKKISDDRVKLFYHDNNRGKGAALRTGFSEVTGDIVIIQDADLEYNPADYRIVLVPILDGRADVVYGSRFRGGPQRVLLFWHYMGNRLITFIADMLYNTNLSDIETCYKAFRRKILDRIKFHSDGFGFEVEFTAKVTRRKYRIYEVPIQYSGRTYEEGKKLTWREGIIALWLLLKYRISD